LLPRTARGEKTINQLERNASLLTARTGDGFADGCAFWKAGKKKGKPIRDRKNNEELRARGTASEHANGTKERGWGAGKKKRVKSNWGNDA